MSTKKNRPSSTAKLLCVLENCQKRDHVGAREAEVARIGEEIEFDATALDAFDVKGCLPVHFDLLVLCAAIEFADRRWKRPLSWRRTIHMSIPVIDLQTWLKPDVQGSLRNVLRHLTCDEWFIRFTQAKNRSPIGERQGELVFPIEKTFAIAYSDGLDSRAVSALSGNFDEGLCFRVARSQQRRKYGDSYFAQIPFKVVGHSSIESSFRSRGFQFSAVTAIAAHLSNISRIVVPESGQGALGPVLLPLHNIYADYRNHPAFFRKMERFIEAVLGCQVRYEQPRLWFTKGQTLRAFLGVPGKSEEILKGTHSCWQRRRIVNLDGGMRHCGLCAACLLRRLSMHVAGISEGEATYVVDQLEATTVLEAVSVLHRKADQDIMMEYGRAGVRHLQQLADLADVSDDRLWADSSEIAAATGASLENTQEKLRSMLVTHATEWREFLSAQGEQSFLKSWMEGGRHVRLE